MKQITQAPKPAAARADAVERAGAGIPDMACQNKPLHTASQAARP